MKAAEQLRAQLADPALSGLIALDGDDADDIRVATSQLGFAVIDVDLRGADRATMFARFAAACGFPAWFGHNWDALLDSLSDWSWRELPGYALFVTGIEQVELEPADVRTLAEILDEATRRMAHHGTPMWICVVGHASVV
jgi:hypothetical protein